jgi:hypothetical protein
MRRHIYAKELLFASTLHKWAHHSTPPHLLQHLRIRLSTFVDMIAANSGNWLWGRPYWGRGDIAHAEQEQEQEHEHEQAGIVLLGRGANGFEGTSACAMRDRYVYEYNIHTYMSTKYVIYIWYFYF